MNISGETVIFKNKNGNGYYTSLSNKKEDDTFDKMFITVSFRKGVEVENFTKINITNGFLTFYSYANNQEETVKNVKLMIMDFDIIETYESKERQNTTNDNSNDFIYPSNDDLPF